MTTRQRDQQQGHGAAQQQQQQSQRDVTLDVQTDESFAGKKPGAGQQGKARAQQNIQTQGPAGQQTPQK